VPVQGGVTCRHPVWRDSDPVVPALDAFVLCSLYYNYACGLLMLPEYLQLTFVLPWRPLQSLLRDLRARGAACAC
jgi:hypothetical protein